MVTMLSLNVLAIVLFLFVPSICIAQVQSQPAAASKSQHENASSTSDDSMVLIRGGAIQMGIDASEIARFEKIFGIPDPQLFQDEVPKHWVAVDSFYIDKYLVTNKSFKSFTDSNPEWQPGRIPPALDNGNYLKHWTTPAALAAKADHPAVNVNWYAAVAYCTWAGKRLPSETEWEYAARAGLDAIFPWGNEPADKTRANYGATGLGTTSSVGTYPPNQAGLFDMAGNVWQFLIDEWKPYSSTSANRPVAERKPTLDTTEFLHVKTRRVIRGGSFGGAPVNLWVEYRDSHPPNGSREFVGFRCAK
jgi:formylglycine-generating enzyme required for sulfatase activity